MMFSKGKIVEQLRSVIQWEPSDDALFEVWSTSADELKNCSKLIVKPGQGCIFLYEGRVEAVLTTPQLYELKTANIPFWTTITKFMQAFQSEHKVGLYFFRAGEIVNLKWGTQSPVSYTDPTFGFPVKLRCHGTLSAKIQDPVHMMTNVVMSRSKYTLEDFKELLLGRLLSPLGDHLAEQRISFADVDRNRNEIASALMKQFGQDVTALGCQLTDFRISGTSFDEETERRIGAIGDAHVAAQTAAIKGFTTLQQEQLNILKTAAANEGGAASTGAALGAGVTMGQMMVGMMAGGQQNQGPKSSENDSSDPMARLQKLKQMLDAGLISPAEFESKKKEILSRV